MGMFTNEYLAFMRRIGRTSDGDPIYLFDFTSDTDAGWGDFFNVTPAVIVPNLEPMPNCISHRAKAVFPRDIVTANENGCFSMQDCIDGIIALGFAEADEDSLFYNGAPLCFMFGEPSDSVEEKVKAIGSIFFDIEEVDNGDDGIMDDLIDQLKEENDDGDNGEDDE